MAPGVRQRILHQKQEAATDTHSYSSFVSCLGMGLEIATSSPYLMLPWSFHTSIDSALCRSQDGPRWDSVPHGRENRICEGAVSIANAAGCRLQSPACTVDGRHATASITCSFRMEVQGNSSLCMESIAGSVRQPLRTISPGKPQGDL